MIQKSETLIMVMLAIFIIGVVIVNYVSKLFRGNPNSRLVNMACYSIILNLMIFAFLYISFHNVKFKRGPQGPRGNFGPKGHQGIPDRCSICGPQQNTIGSEKVSNYKNNLVVPQKPLLPDERVLQDKWGSIWGKPLRIYTNNGNCGLEWSRTKGSKSLYKDNDIKGNSRISKFDCEGNSDIFVLQKEGKNIYLETKPGKSPKYCSLKPRSKKGGDNIKNSDNIGYFDCGPKRHHVFIDGDDPKNFTLSSVDKNGFRCGLIKNSSSGGGSDISGNEHAAVFNCTDKEPTRLKIVTLQEEKAQKNSK
jgi:hypothetical protein